MSNRLLSRSILSISSKRSTGGVLFLNSRRAARSFSLTSTSLGEFTIPVVDFGRFLNSKTQAEKEDAAKQVVDALVERGFMVSESREIAWWSGKVEGGRRAPWKDILRTIRGGEIWDKLSALTVLLNFYCVVSQQPRDPRGGDNSYFQRGELAKSLPSFPPLLPADKLTAFCPPK